MAIDWEAVWPGLRKVPDTYRWDLDYSRYWAQPNQIIDKIHSNRLPGNRLHVFSQYAVLHERIRLHRDYEQKRRIQYPNSATEVDGPVVILGTPGIGKSVFLLYFAARLMTEQTPFVLYDSLGYHVFFEGGVLVADRFPTGPEEASRLYDAAVNVPLLLDIDLAEYLPDRVISKGCKFFVVQAASPPKANYRWTKQRENAALFVMNPHKDAEVLALLKSRAPYKSDGDIRSTYEAYGPNLRTVLQVLRTGYDPSYNIEVAVNALHWTDLKNFPGSVTAEEQTDQLVKSVCFHRMRDGACGADPLVHTIANPTVMRFVLARWSAYSPETLNMLRRFSRLSHTSSSAGWLFEAWVHAAMCSIGSVTLHPMFKTRGGTYQLVQDAPETLTIPKLTSETLRDIDDVKQQDTYYIHVAANRPAFDAYCSLPNDECAFQMTLASTHSLNKSGLDILGNLMKRRPSTNKRFIFVIPKGRQFTFKPRVNINIRELTYWVMYVDLDGSAKEAIERACKERDAADLNGDTVSIDETDGMVQYV